MSDKPELIMLVGLPGSGKSYFTSNIKAKNPEKEYVVISSDDIIEEKCREAGLTYSEGYEKFVGYASQTMKIRAKQAFNNRQNVIWDQTNMSAKARRSKMGLFEGYAKQAVVFSIPDSLLKERLETRAKATGKVIPDFVIKNMSNTYQAPTRDEGFDSITYIRN